MKITKFHYLNSINKFNDKGLEQTKLVKVIYNKCRIYIINIRD